MQEPTNTAIPPRLAQIIEDFQLAEGREKLDLLLEYAEKMQPLPERLRLEHGEMDKVEECMTPVYVQSELQDGKLKYFFDVPPESPTVRGYAALLEEGVDGSTPEEVLRIPGSFFRDMGLHLVLTQQRLNGISAILAHMKQQALRKLDEQAGAG